MRRISLAGSWLEGFWGTFSSSSSFAMWTSTQGTSPDHLMSGLLLHYRVSTLDVVFARSFVWRGHDTSSHHRERTLIPRAVFISQPKVGSIHTCNSQQLIKTLHVIAFTPGGISDRDDRHNTQSR